MRKMKYMKWPKAHKILQSGDFTSLCNARVFGQLFHIYYACVFFIHNVSKSKFKHSIFNPISSIEFSHLVRHNCAEV